MKDIDKNKALEIADNIVQKESKRFGVKEWNEFNKTHLIDAAMEAMDWKNENLVKQHRIIRNHWQEWAEEQKQQLIDKACEWLRTCNYTFPYKMIEDFKKAIYEN